MKEGRKEEEEERKRKINGVPKDQPKGLTGTDGASELLATTKLPSPHLTAAVSQPDFAGLHPTPVHEC